MIYTEFNLHRYDFRDEARPERKMRTYYDALTFLRVLRAFARLADTDVSIEITARVVVRKEGSVRRQSKPAHLQGG